MPKQSPVPIAHAFLVCRQITHDAATGEYTLIAPQFGFALPHFPFTVGVNIYAQVSAVRGEYHPEFRVWGPDGEIVWELRLPVPMTSPNGDPLIQIRLVSQNLMLPFPCPGRYDLSLLANGTEIARYPLRIEQAEAPTS
jgi:hypothetical protein